MMGARRERWEVQGVPSASLLRLNRHALPNILVVGGAPCERAAAVRMLHVRSRLHERPFCAMSATGDSAGIERALLGWLGHDAGLAAPDCERGTLFIDDVTQLPVRVQRLLQLLARRLEGTPVDARLGPGPARLAAGCAMEPAEEVSQGRLLTGLHDSLEKLCLHLGILTASVAGSRASAAVHAAEDRAHGSEGRAQTHTR